MIEPVRDANQWHRLKVQVHTPNLAVRSTVGREPRFALTQDVEGYAQVCQTNPGPLISSLALSTTHYL